MFRILQNVIIFASKLSKWHFKFYRSPTIIMKIILEGLSPTNPTQPNPTIPEPNPHRPTQPPASQRLRAAALSCGLNIPERGLSPTARGRKYWRWNEQPARKHHDLLNLNWRRSWRSSSKFGKMVYFCVGSQSAFDRRPREKLAHAQSSLSKQKSIESPKILKRESQCFSNCVAQERNTLFLNLLHQKS